MLITFPNMGNVALAARALCQGLELDYVMPEQNNKKTLQRGSFYAPKEICLPFKIMLGNFLEAIERGADTILFVGSRGPCRFGEYCELFMKILNKLGYGHVSILVADFSPEIGLEELKARFAKLMVESPVTAARKLRAVSDAMRIEALSDRLDAQAYKLAGYELSKGACKKILHEYKGKAAQSLSPGETLSILKTYAHRLGEVPKDPERDPIEIAVIGEIYTVIDPFSNLYIEEKLMDYGVSSVRTMTPTWWVKDLVRKPVGLNSIKINRAAQPYLPFPVGGHCRECIGEAVCAGKRGMDGAIQILPLGCMPEILAKAILPAVRRDWGLPVMTLIVDEVTGEAGYVTRVEAYLDMLKSARKNRSARRKEPFSV
jgi:predicted nucleotide-binding protein (sugar kinase/HSP70/actin superfamily)